MPFTVLPIRKVPAAEGTPPTAKILMDELRDCQIPGIESGGEGVERFARPADGHRGKDPPFRPPGRSDGPAGQDAAYNALMKAARSFFS